MKKCIKRAILFSAFLFIPFISLINLSNSLTVFSMPTISGNEYNFYCSQNLREDIRINLNLNGANLLSVKWQDANLLYCQYDYDETEKILTIYKSFLLSLNAGSNDFTIETSDGNLSFTINIIKPVVANYDDDFGDQGSNGWYYMYCDNTPGVSNLNQADKYYNNNNIIMWSSSFCDELSFRSSVLRPHSCKPLVLQWQNYNAGIYTINYELIKKQTTDTNGIGMYAYTYKNDISLNKDFYILPEYFSNNNYTYQYTQTIELGVGDCLNFKVDALNNSNYIFDFNISIETAGYNVNFNDEDNLFCYQNILSGDKAVMPEKNPVKENYVFDGWYTSNSYQTLFDFDSIINSDTEIFAKWTEEFDIDVNISGDDLTIATSQKDGCLYQYWIKLFVSTDGENNLNKNSYFWNMVQPFIQSNSITIPFSESNIQNDLNIIIRINDNGEIKQQYKYFNIQDLNLPQIENIKTNGENITDNIIAVKKSELLNITAIGNKDNLSYNLYKDDDVIYSNNSGEFDIDLSEFYEGYQDFYIKANDGTNEDIKQFKAYIYDTYNTKSPVIYSIDGNSLSNGQTTFSMQVKYADGSNILNEDINNLDFSLLSNSVCLQQTNAYFDNGIYTLQYYIDYNNKHGIYRLYGQAKRNDLNTCDVMIKYYKEYARDSILTINASDITTNVGSDIIISASGNINNENDGVLYAFYREDASGWTLIKDYSENNMLIWRPLKAGLYKIQARIKGVGEGCYELAKSEIFTVTGNSLNEEITFYITDIETNEQNVTILSAGKPYMLCAETENSNVLYMYTVYNHSTGLLYLNNYSTKNTFIFIPDKPADYILTVRVITADNFGFKDKSVSLNVQSII